MEREVNAALSLGDPIVLPVGSRVTFAGLDRELEIIRLDPHDVHYVYRVRSPSLFTWRRWNDVVEVVSLPDGCPPLGELRRSLLWR